MREREREELRERPGERGREKSRKRRKQWSGVEGGGRWSHRGGEEADGGAEVGEEAAKLGLLR